MSLETNIANLSSRLCQGRFLNGRALIWNTIIRLAAEATGLSFGKDIVVGL